NRDVQRAFHALKNYPAGARRHLVAHEDADFIEFLPFPIEGEQRADLEVSSGDVERVRDLAPLVELRSHIPVRVAVVDDEEVATRGLVFHFSATYPTPVKFGQYRYN